MELFKAIEGNDLLELRRLLESGIEVNVVDDINNQNTPLHVAIKINNEHMARELLLPKWNLDINARNFNGDTPLHTAALSGHDTFIHLLLERQALNNIRNKENMTFLDIVIRRTLLFATPYRLNMIQKDLYKENVPLSRIISGN